MNLENSPDRFVDQLLQTLTDLDLLRPGATCGELEAFRQSIKVQLRLHKLRVPRLYSTKETQLDL